MAGTVPLVNNSLRQMLQDEQLHFNTDTVCNFKCAEYANIGVIVAVVQPFEIPQISEKCIFIRGFLPLLKESFQVIPSVSNLFSHLFTIVMTVPVVLIEFW